MLYVQIKINVWCCQWICLEDMNSKNVAWIFNHDVENISKAIDFVYIPNDFEFEGI